MQVVTNMQKNTEQHSQQNYHTILLKTTQNTSCLDLFGGTGSTLIACEQLDRKCYCMELDPHYVDVIIERWENYTGKKGS